MTQRLKIYSDSDSLRIRYTFDFIFKQTLGITYSLVSSTEASLHYLRKPDGNYSLFQSSIMMEGEIQKQKVYWEEWKNTPALRFNYESHPDIFATIFYLISRYEEYYPHTPDSHGRYSYKNSILTRINKKTGDPYLHQPVVDQLIKQFAAQFNIAYNKKLQWLPTVDVDTVYAFRHAGLRKSTGKFLKSMSTGRWGMLQSQINYLRGEGDPYNTYQLLEEIHGSATYFLLMTGEAKFDVLQDTDKYYYRKWLKKLQKNNNISLHPSYDAAFNTEDLRSQKKVLERVSGRAINSSRFHYLRFSLPESYRNLILVDINNDYSMGYASSIGFRAGTAFPFFWYDLKKEEETELKVFPFQIMDGTLNRYLKLSPEEAKHCIQKIKRGMEPTGGNFCTIWHNSSLTSYFGWGGYEKVYRYIAECFS